MTLQQKHDYTADPEHPYIEAFFNGTDEQIANLFGTSDNFTEDLANYWWKHDTAEESKEKVINRHLPSSIRLKILSDTTSRSTELSDQWIDRAHPWYASLTSLYLMYVNGMDAIVRTKKRLDHAAFKEFTEKSELFGCSSHLGTVNLIKILDNKKKENYKKYEKQERDLRVMVGGLFNDLIGNDLPDGLRVVHAYCDSFCVYLSCNGFSEPKLNVAV